MRLCVALCAVVVALMNWASSLMFAVNGILFLACQRLIKKVYIGRLDNIIAFELASIVLFVLWLPLAIYAEYFGAWDLYHLVNGRELFDVVLVFGLSYKLFTSRYRRFIAQHHMIGVASRTLIVGLCWFFLSDAHLHTVTRMILIYYCCSIFLVLPGVLEPLYLRKRPPRTQAYARLTMFISARLSHAGVILYAFASLSEITDHLGARVAIYIATLVIVGLPEVHSIYSSIPSLRKSYRLLFNKRTSARFA